MGLLLCWNCRNPLTPESSDICSRCFPVKEKEHREAFVACLEACPECGGELDTGWECNRCGFDAQPEMRASPAREKIEDMGTPR